MGDGPERVCVIPREDCEFEIQVWCLSQRVTQGRYNEQEVQRERLTITEDVEMPYQQRLSFSQTMGEKSKARARLKSP